jgi:hypothetical protein
MKLGMFALKAALVLGALEAVALGPVPLEWIGMLILLGAGVLLLPRLVHVRQPGLLALLALGAWAVLVHAVNMVGCASVLNCGPLEMPEGATTSYPVYIALRYFVWLAFVAALALAAWLISRGQREVLTRFIVKLGVVVSVIALYVYVAHLYGLPDIPRTRPGTDGEVVSEVTFSYAFHRALGTFREPSHLAVWLVLPFFLSLSGKLLNWRSVLMGTTLLLTGSLTAFVAITAGALCAWAYLLLRGTKGALWLWRLPVVAVILVSFALLPFYFLVEGDEKVDLAAVITERAVPILESGITESNRGYVYEYAAATPLPIIGPGLGNSTLYFTEWMLSDVVVGFLSLYVNVLLSLGIIGLGLLAVFLARPIFQPVGHAREAWPLYAAYFAWLVIFAVHAGELPLMFALTYALIREPPAA